MLDPRQELSEGLRYHKLGMLEEALAKYQVARDATPEPDVLSEALCREALVFRSWCRWDEAIAAARRSASVALAAHLDERYAEALNAEAIVHQDRGLFDEALALHELVVRMTVTDRLRGITLQNMGAIAAQRADLEAARDYFRRSRQWFARAGDQWGEAFALNNQAAAALDSGNAKEAEVLAGQAIVAAKKVGGLELLGICLLNSAEAIAAQRRMDQAETLVLEALRFFEMEENDLRRAQAYRVLGDIKVLQADREAAHRAYVQAIGLAESVGSEREVLRIRDAMETLAAA